MATQANLDLAQTLYIAYYGRPADPRGLNYWADRIEEEGVDSAINAFGASEEFASRFSGLSTEKLINNLYNQLFGRDAEFDGLNYYSNLLESGESTLAEIALDITNGAQNEDATVLANKLEVANEFTASIDTTAEVLAYQGNGAAAAARDFLAGVTDSADSDVDAFLQGMLDASNPGNTFTLTAGVDEINGTSGNDTIDAYPYTNAGEGADTLQSFDSVDGGAGTDRFNLVATEDYNNDLVGTFQNVEVINIRGSDYIGSGLTQQQLDAITTAQTNLTEAEAELATAEANEATAEARFAAVEEAQVLIDAAARAMTVENSTSLAVVYNTVLQAVSGVNADATTKTAVIRELGSAADSGELYAQVRTGTGNNSFGPPSARQVLGRAVDIVDRATDTAFDDAEQALQAAQNNIPTAEGRVITAEGALTNAELAGNPAIVDASFFEGATQISVDGDVTNVDSVENQQITMTGGADINNSVSYVDEVASGTVGLNSANGTLTVDGADLETLNVEGSVKAASKTAAGTVNLADGSSANTVKTLNLNLSTNATVNVAHMAALTAVASTGAGDLALAGLTDSVATVTTAGGDDSLTIRTATSADRGNVVNALVETGAGDDVITVSTTGNGTTTVNAGAGDDTVIMTRALNDNNALDGGAGTDTLSVVASGTPSSGTYVRLAQVDGFENLNFQNGVTLDASEVSNFAELHFASASSVTNAIADQLLVTSADLEVEAAGFDADADTDAAGVADAGDVSVKIVDTAHLAVAAKSADIIVDTTEAEDSVGLTMGGKPMPLTNGSESHQASVVESVNLNLVSNTDEAGEDAYMAGAYIDATNMGENFTSLTIEGTGKAYVDNGGYFDRDSESSGTLKTIDASGLESFIVDEEELSGLNFFGSDSVQESVTVSGGEDLIVINSRAGSSSLDKMDTIEGLELSLNEEGRLAEGSDEFILDFDSASDDAYSVFEFDSTSPSLAAAVNTVAASDDDNAVFAFGGDTYIFSEAADGATSGDFEASDMLVKLVGSYDLEDVATIASSAIV